MKLPASPDASHRFLPAALFVGLCFCAVLASCGKPLSPRYAGYSHLRMEKAGFKNNIITADIKLYNPNKYNLQLRSGNAKVYFNDHLLGEASFDSLIILRSKDTTLVPLQMQATAKAVLTNTARLLFNPNINLKVEGKLKAGRHRLFVNVPVNYEGIKRIEILGKDTTAGSAVRRVLIKRLTSLLLQPVKTPLLILELILAIFDLTDKNAISGRSDKLKEYRQQGPATGTSNKTTLTIH